MINDLIAKLEAATEGSRKLDALIHNACIAMDESEEAQFPNPYIHEAEGLHSFVRGGFWHRIPAYTTSIDTALTLIKGVPFIEITIDGPEGETFVLLSSHTPSDGRQKELARSYAATTPIALCIAVLKARSKL